MKKLLFLIIPCFLLAWTGAPWGDTTVEDFYASESLFVGDAIVDTGTCTILGETNLGDAATDTVTVTGVAMFADNVKLRSDSSTTAYHIIKGSGAEDRHADTTDLRIGLSETDRRLIICDLGDIDTDLGLTKRSTPALYVYDATVANSIRIDDNGLYWTGSNPSIQSSGKYFGWNTATDNNDNAHTYKFSNASAGNGELTDADAEQSYVLIDLEVNQTSTAGYTALDVDALETSTGSGDNNLLRLQVASAEKYSVGNEGTTAQEIYVIRKHVALSGAADNVATAMFTITTTDETGSADGGMYSVSVHATVGEATAASGAVNTASVGLLAHWTRIMASAGTGANSAIVEVNESASANEGSGAISAVTMTVAETSEFVQTVSIQVNTSGGTVDAFALVELVYSDFTTAPVIANP